MHNSDCFEEHIFSLGLQAFLLSENIFVLIFYWIVIQIYMKGGFMEKDIAVIHTGGTFAMESNNEGFLKPGDYAHEFIEKNICHYTSSAIDQHQLLNLDSAQFKPSNWIQIARYIEKIYEDYRAFIIIHGTDTMAFTASALSFILKNLSKPILLTGSQLPLKNKRSDALSNLMTAVEVAQECNINEVAVVFNNQVFRGNRVKKKNAWDFNAFYSPNYPPLIKLGINIEEHAHLYLNLKKTDEPFHIDDRLNEKVLLIPFFPGINLDMLYPLVHGRETDGIVIEAFGSGNIPINNKGLEKLFYEAAGKDIPIAVCSQSPEGKVNFSLYEVASKAHFYGLISTVDMTREATVVKLMTGLGRYKNLRTVKRFMQMNIAGEKES